MEKNRGRGDCDARWSPLISDVTPAAVACPVLILPTIFRTPGRNWYALQVEVNRVFRVREWLRELGIEEFCPTYEEKVRWSDREKTRTLQLYPGYLFVRLGLGQLNPVLELPGVIEILPGRLAPIAIDDAEIGNLRAVVAQKVPAAPCAYVAGDPVTIESGPLAGVSGVVVRTEGQLRVVVGVEMLGRAVSVKIEAADLRKAA